jgi:tRNA G18 (ribose-2'-O)-methylase SpoU
MILKNWGAKITKCLGFSNRSSGFSIKSCFLVVSPHLCSILFMRKLRLQELNRLSTEDFRLSAKLPFVAVLDNIRSMHNVGSFFRTADAFRCEKLLLCGITAQPPHRDITKTALGADRSVAWDYFTDTGNAVRALKQDGYYVIGVEQTTQSQPLQQFVMPNQPIAVIFGNEIDGIQSEVLELCNACIEIPQAGTKHSLNVSVAAGIVLWHFCAPHLSSLP